MKTYVVHKQVLQTYAVTVQAQDVNEAIQKAAQNDEQGFTEYPSDKIQSLIDCARDVVNNWEHGDLAAAVRELEFSLNDLGHKRDTPEPAASPSGVIGDEGDGGDETEAEQLLSTVQTTQTAFWDALHELEDELGVELDSTRDYSNTSVSDLTEEDESNG